jgi:3-dehydroquinate synthase
MKTIEINIPNKEYKVHINNGLLYDIDKYIDVFREIVIVTDDFIPKEYLKILKTKIPNPLIFEVPMGETSKSIDVAYTIINEMIEENISRGALIIALGGGVVGDLTGFIASIYMRGIDFIQIPTTLLSQIDSSVGGKVGINSENMKNSIGSFYQPKVVLIDPTTLNTLSEKEFNNGIAEMIKYGLIADKSLFYDILEKDVKENIEYYIYKCIEIKRSVVVNDEFDTGIRQILNFGHTIGHAIEQDSKYNLLHGEAVSVGMNLMSLNTTYHDDIVKILNKYSLPLTYKYDKETIYNIIKTDKKVKNNKLNIIVVDEVGNGLIKTINLEEIKKYLR